MRAFGPKFFPLSFLVASLAVACSDDNSPASNSNNNNSSNNNNNTSSGLDASVQVEDDAGFETPDSGIAPDAGFQKIGACRSDPVNVTPDPACNSGTFVEIIRGTIQDQDGNPIETFREGVDGFPAVGAGVNVCIAIPNEFPKCLPPEAGCEGGYFEVDILDDPDDRCIGSAVMRVFPYTNTFATTYCQIPLAPTPTSDFTVETPYQLYEIEPPTTLPPRGDSTAQRTVVFEGGIEVDLAPDDLSTFEEVYEQLRSRLISATDPTPCGSDGFDGIVAFGPERNVTTGMPLRIPADGLAPGTQVDLFVLGGLECRNEDGDFIKEGEWEQFGTGTVDANGMIAGGNLPCFNWLAWRAQ